MKLRKVLLPFQPPCARLRAGCRLTANQSNSSLKDRGLNQELVWSLPNAQAIFLVFDNSTLKLRNPAGADLLRELFSRPGND
jgi:hypothetical protein